MKDEQDDNATFRVYTQPIYEQALHSFVETPRPYSIIHLSQYHTTTP